MITSQTMIQLPVQTSIELVHSKDFSRPFQSRWWQRCRGTPLRLCGRPLRSYSSVCRRFYGLKGRRSNATRRTRGGRAFNVESKEDSGFIQPEWPHVLTVDGVRLHRTKALSTIEEVHSSVGNGSQASLFLLAQAQSVAFRLSPRFLLCTTRIRQSSSATRLGPSPSGSIQSFHSRASLGIPGLSLGLGPSLTRSPAPAAMISTPFFPAQSMPPKSLSAVASSPHFEEPLSISYHSSLSSLLRSRPASPVKSYQSLKGTQIILN
jgi:hypothetical protein